ncbi:MULTISPECIES: DUF4870 domain-containing protein [unclassified Rummeliibacillus]|uniref:DUF4870 domain-containing protein n=1 Tax=unclassified Rummeliibacillus TaxID=2622809 RepID=UPI000E673DF3|nr:MULTISPECIES: DUF4870 domain-containing protein [unclassified Rummeliibacillus]RIJ66118.1 DUF4870 domain-containing protein [Rummeliibacillus sp. POC4]RPJ96689.1 DUF4870 domain-containing protein [Rummeliibacillus sp. TYF005]
MEEKGIKVILHASAFFAPCLVPILFFLFIKDEEVKKLSIQALLFQFVMWLLVGVGTFLSITIILAIIGIPMIIVFGLMGIIVPIIGIVKALQDEAWDYPIVGKWI